MNPVLLGLDAGGSATRAVAIDLDERILGTGRARAANPQVRSPRQVSAALSEATGQALHDVAPAVVAGGVLGLAGLAATARPEVGTAIAAAWRRCGLDCPIRIVGDAVAAFTSATSRPDGAVIIAGTGAVTVQLRDRDIVRTVDGLGWLLGDEGSGFWLGLAAARRTARHLAAGYPHTDFTEAICGHFGETQAEPFVTACYRRPREALAELAPVVCGRAEAGDPEALQLVAEAGRRLADGYAALGPAPGPVVITGSLLTNPTPVRFHLLRALAELTDTTVSVARDAALGAAWLAVALDDRLTATATTELHKRLFPEADR